MNINGKRVGNKEARYVIINQKIHDNGTASQASYNIPMDFFKVSISKGIFKHDDDLIWN